VRKTRQYGQLRRRPSRTIKPGILLAAAKHAKELHLVCGADGIGVCEDDHRGP